MLELLKFCAYAVQVLFKYICSDSIDLILSNLQVSLRFQYPKDFNDPYELFVQPDNPLDSDTLAFFNYYLGEIPQLPTACFSKRPDLVTLWAHYAKNFTGICIGFDEEKLSNQFPVAYLNEVDYQDSPGAIPSGLIQHAFNTGKNRHVEHFMLPEAYRAAYFVKHQDWAYEEEKRLVVNDSDVKDKNGILLSFLPAETVKIIIVGMHCLPQTQTKCGKFAERNKIDLFQVNTVRNSFKPYFTKHNDGSGAQWDKDKFVKVSLCENCLNPLNQNSFNQLCDVCQISEDQNFTARTKNMHGTEVALGLIEPRVAFARVSPVGYEISKGETDK